MRPSIVPTYCADSVMKFILSIMFVAIVLCFSNSCSTIFIWDKTDPDAPVWIPADQITQEELDRRGLPYLVCNDKPPYGFIVEKSRLHKFGDYTVRTLTTPITVIVDGALIAGFVWLHWVAPFTL
jgi:hypothetical protein